MATRSVATVFGGSGFIGRYVVKRLTHKGFVVRVAVRDTEGALFLKPMGAVGQVVPLYAMVARLAARSGVGSLVHISAIGADPQAASQYAASKGIGERLVREGFADATVLRPSLVFGPEDRLFNRFAGMAQLLPFMPVICGDTRFQPVFVGDVADAVMASLGLAEAAGAVFELGGPMVYTFRELLAYILKETGRHRPMVDIPLGLARLQALFMELVPGKPLTRDQLLMLQKDNVVGPDVPGLKELGITPRPLGLFLDRWMTRYRKYGRFNERAPS